MAKKKGKTQTREAGTLQKGLRLLTVLGTYPEGARFTDLAKDTGYPVSTTHRVLATLKKNGFVEYNQERRLYTLGLRIFQLSHRVAIVASLSRTAGPIMQLLAEKAGCVVLLNALDGAHTLVLDRAEPRQSVQVHTRIGSRLPLHSTASGKAILAGLSLEQRNEILDGATLERVTSKTVTNRINLEKQLRTSLRRGFGTSNEENEDGIRAIAVQIPTATTTTRKLALSLAAPAAIVSAKKLASKIGLLQEAAADIGDRLIAYR
ncbi:MAG: IclR family transcriptional regulator [Pseudomonadota bacterium]